MQLLKWEYMYNLTTYNFIFGPFACTASMGSFVHEARQLLLLSSEILLITLKSEDTNIHTYIQAQAQTKAPLAPTALAQL